jgi:hypothetical protein
MPTQRSYVYDPKSDYEKIRLQAQDKKTKSLGQLIDVGSYRLHIYCIGEGSPTVVMDSGGGATLEAWRLVQPEVAKFTRTCTSARKELLKP